MLIYDLRRTHADIEQDANGNHIVKGIHFPVWRSLDPETDILYGHVLYCVVCGESESRSFRMETDAVEAEWFKRALPCL